MGLGFMQNTVSLWIYFLKDLYFCFILAKYLYFILSKKIENENGVRHVEIFNNNAIMILVSVTKLYTKPIC